MQHLQQTITCLRAARISRKKRNAVLTELFWAGKKGRDLSEKEGVKQALTALEDDGDIRTTRGGKAKLTPQGVERFAAISKKKADLVENGVRQHAAVIAAGRVPWVYHVTTIGRLPGIQAKGLRPGRTATWGSHAAHSKGKIFFTTARGVPRWMHKIWYAIGGDTAEEVPVVLRLRADKLTDAERDHLGTRDALENAYAVRTGVPAALLSVWDGQRWLRLKDTDPEALAEAARERSEVEVVESEEEDEDGEAETQEIVWWNEEALEPPLPVAPVEVYSRERKLPGSAIRAARGVHVVVKELPTVVQRALDEVGYKRRDIQIETATSFAMQDHNWSGGYRDFDVLVNLKTGEYSQGSTGDTQKRHPLPDGFVLIQGSIGGGKPVYAVLMVNPSTMAPLLPEAKTEVTPQERKALDIIGGLISSYRGDAFVREGLGKYGPSNPLILSLVEKGMLKMNAKGSVVITTEGKNARKNP